MKKTLKLVIPVVIIFAIIVLAVKCISNPQPTDFSDTIPVIENDNSTNDKKSENENSTNDKKNTADLIKFNYEFNPHVISKEYLVIYGEDIEKNFYDFCDAILNGESTFQCESTEKYNAVLDISRICLPIASEFVDKDKAYVENNVGHITYNIEKEELHEKATQFKDKVSDVITSAIPYKEDDFILAMELLTAVANKNTYDEEGNSIENVLKLQPYRTIMEDKGICHEIAGEYIYYLLQVGINAINCDGIDKNQEYAHEWAVVELDGEYYHVDPTFAIKHKDSLEFFCINDEMREQKGNFNMEELSFAYSSKINYKIDSIKYKDLWEAENYTIDHENRKIYMTMFDSGEKKEYNY